MNLRNPKTFTEKIQWLKIFDAIERKRLKAKLVDKVKVKDFVALTIGQEYVINNLGVWSTVDEIDFEALPRQFVLKCNHGWNFNIIVKDKNRLKVPSVKSRLGKWMKTQFGNFGIEPQYRDVERRILCEEYIELLGGKMPDYKLHCFHGNPSLIQVISNRFIKPVTEDWFDTDWKRLDRRYSVSFQSGAGEYTSPPSNLDTMLNIASQLSAGFKYVRVDLYSLSQGEIKFGELTFTPAGGYKKWDYDLDLEIGKMIDLSTR